MTRHRGTSRMAQWGPFQILSPQNNDKTGQIVKINHFRTLEINEKHTTHWKVFVQEKLLNGSKNSRTCSILTWGCSHVPTSKVQWPWGPENWQSHGSWKGWPNLKLYRKASCPMMILGENNQGRSVSQLPKAMILVRASNRPVRNFKRRSGKWDQP